MTLTAKKIRPYIKVLLLIALLAAAAYLYYFLRFIFYPALTGSQTVAALQKNIGIQTVDVDKFNSLVENISQKTSAPAASVPAVDPFR
ncbi:MAG TPA: hypothetical protein VMD74_05535 [Candidatus Methylomirabilis sp.]|nr:hypothetical protein [Candidatus Methylomirabilis sp.]